MTDAGENAMLKHDLADGSRIVADGRERALKGAKERLEEHRTEITAGVEASYASQLATAGTVRRIWLKFLMKRDIARQMGQKVEKFSPSDALYIEQSCRHSAQ